MKETYWEKSGVRPQTEIVEINGQKYTLKQLIVIHYTYNEKGQIIQEQPEAPSEKYYTTYEYTPTTIVRTRMLLQEGKGIIPVKTMFQLNAMGLDDSKQYDSEGYPVEPQIQSRRVIRENGNVVLEEERPGGGWLYRVTYSHDLTRPNLPNMYPFLGKTDKNLLVEEVISSPDVDIYKPGELYRIRYHYEFDKYGRVKRLIRTGKDEKDSGWPLMRDNGHIGVFDYEYECP